jgi:hypothetical protein
LIHGEGEDSGHGIRKSLKYFNKKLARCGIRCEDNSMMNTKTSAETDTAQAIRTLADIIAASEKGLKSGGGK